MVGVGRRVRGGSIIALALVGITACAGEEQGPNKGELKLHGTVHMVQASDGSTCWRFDSKKGKSYELQPAQVPRELLVDGATAVLIAKPRTGGSFCKVGTIVDVVKSDSISAASTTASR